jgi:ubiquinone/menaquinone biosynthesis C-methylase UbiE
MPLLDHFSWIAPYYDRIFYLPHADSLVARVQPEPHHRLLDVGGGTGRVARHFAGQVAQVCILDPSATMLQEGQRKGICITRGEAEELPFCSGTFDRIIMVDAFHHLRDQQVAVHELMRVLAAGGRLVVEEPDIADWRVKWVALGEKALMMRSHFCAPERMRAMFERAGGDAHVESEGFTSWIVVCKQ